MPVVGKRANTFALCLLPLITTLVCAAAIYGLMRLGATDPLEDQYRIPVKHPRPDPTQLVMANPGTLIPGTGKPSDLPGYWPWFRGPDGNNIAPAGRKLAREWPESGPPKLWSVEVGEGHAGVAVHNGCVYIIDYDRDKQEDVVRCLSLDKGEEIWRYTYSVPIVRNHGMSRCVPAVNDQYVVTMGPKCHVLCLNAKTGEKVWMRDLVKENETTIPLWYAGQCPVFDGDRVIIAPGAKPLVMAIEIATGKVVWESSPPGIKGMTHASLALIEFAGRRQAVVAANDGLVGIALDNGEHLWTFGEWSMKTIVPTPVLVNKDRLFLTAGYNAGATMIRLVEKDGRIEAVKEYHVEPNIFGSDQQTPIFYKDHLFAVEPRPKTEMVCFDPKGERVWNSGPDARFDLGPYLISDDLLVILDGKTGQLRLAEASTTGYQELASAEVFKHGHDCWAPMAIADGRLILRDMVELVCLDLGVQK